MTTGLSRGSQEERNFYSPAGVVLPFAGDTAPSGWAICDGSTISRTEYPELFAALGTIWGEGDGSTTFHLPDMRGRFMRGTDSGAGRDTDVGSRTPSNAGGNSGDNVGSSQNDSVKQHGHTLNAGMTQAVAAIAVNSMSWQRAGDPNGSGNVTRDGYVLETGSNIGTETRGQNVNFNYIIKL
jgi:microcystin-dependent protein